MARPTTSKNHKSQLERDFDSCFCSSNPAVSNARGPSWRTKGPGWVIAREHGVPAVVATGEATRVLRDGIEVTVDGRAGTVTIHEEVAAAGAPARLTIFLDIK